MSQEMNFDDLTALVPGTVGEPGARVFYLQARRDTSALSVRCEKQHVAAVAEYLSTQLDDAPQPGPDSVPEISFQPPDRHEMIAGSLGIGHDAANGLFVIVLHALGEDDDGDRIRISLNPGQALAFVRQAEELLAGGRPPCPFCEAPIDPAGHACPRMN